MAKVEQKHLGGLTYKTSRTIKGDDGKKKYIPVERPLVLDHLLDQSDQGNNFVVVTKDGRKHTIPKNPLKVAAAEPEDNADKKVEG